MNRTSPVQNAFFPGSPVIRRPVSVVNKLMISRTPFLTTMAVVGQYRYRNVLQIIPAKPQDPSLPFELGWYGGTLAVSFDEKDSSERNTDFWAHDHRERERFETIKSKAKKEDWLNAVSLNQSNKRCFAIEKEALNLLQVITNNIFRKPNQEHDWYFDSNTKSPVFCQGWYPSFETDNWGSFWEGDVEEIRRIDPELHYGRLGIGSDDFSITLPLNIEVLLDKYFAMTPDRKITFARACELFRSAQEIWTISKSLALAAHVFAVDALCHVDDPTPKRCASCGNLISENICNVCGGPKFGLTRRFRDFVTGFIDHPEEQKFASSLFSVRSDIAHRGKLLHIDEYATEFNVGGSDNQFDYSYRVGRVVRKILVGWLLKTDMK